MSVRVEFRWSEEFKQRVDAAAGFESRASFVRRAVERALEVASLPKASPVPSLEHSTPAPAEQPEMTIDEALTAYGVTPADDSTLTRNRSPRVSPSGPASPRVPFRRDVKPFQRGS